MFRSLALIVALSLPLAGHSESVGEVKNKAYFICKSQKEVRTIRVSVDKAGMCSTLYSKQGREKSVGEGKNPDTCLSILKNIKANLEKSSWTCRDISSARMTAAVK